MEPHHGMAIGHLPVRSYLAAPVISRTGEVIGGLFFGHPEPGRFTPHAERFAVGIAAHAAIAIDNTGLFSKAEAELARRKAAEAGTLLLGAIVDSSDDAIISKDLNGVITSWNKSAQRLFGYTAEEAVGRSVAELLIPWTVPSQYKEKFPKKSPFDGGVLAVQVNFRNDSGESLRVNLDKIRLNVQIDEDNRQEVPSLTPEQLADAALKPKTKDPTASRGPRLPVPLPSKKGGRDKHWDELEKEADNAPVPTSVVSPTSTVQGLLYFDLDGQFDLLQTAHLYIPQIAKMNHTGALTYFDIDLSRHQ